MSDDVNCFYSFIGGSQCLPDGQRAGETAVPGKPRRTVEFQKAGGLL